MSAMEIATPYQRSDYNSLQITATKRASHGLTRPEHLRLRRREDNNSSDDRGRRVVPAAARRTRTSTGRRRTSTSGTGSTSRSCTTCRARSRHKGAAKVLLNDWQVNGILVLRSGPPFTVKSGTDRSLTAIGQDNADQVGDPTPPSRLRTESAVVQPGGVHGGGGRHVRHRRSATRCAARAPRLSTSRCSRTSRSRRAARLQFRLGDVQRVQPASTTTTRTRPITAGANFGKILGAGDPRVIQLGFKFLF